MSNYFGRVYATWNHSETAFGHRKVFESLEAVASEAEEQKESGRDFHNDSDCRKATELKRNSTGCPNSKCDTLEGKHKLISKIHTKSIFKVSESV